MGVSIIEAAKKFDCDLGYQCKDGSMHIVHMHIKFGPEMGELSISVDKNRRRMWLIGDPYEQPYAKFGPKHQSKEYIINGMIDYIFANTVVEWYLENDGVVPED